MTSPGPVQLSQRYVFLAVGIAVGVVIGLAISVALVGSPASSSSGGSGTAGAPTVVGNSAVVNNDTTVMTPPIDAAAGSLLLVFVSWVNTGAGGGAVSAISDSAGDGFAVLTSTGFLYNHTEAVWVTSPTDSDSTLTVSVTFSGGVAPQGGSVALVDVAHAELGSIDGTSVQFGDSGLANVSFGTNHSADLCILGVAGRGVSGPFSAARNETLLNTGTATGGPFEDGVAYGTFSTVDAGRSAAPAAKLNTPTYWLAVGVAID